MLERTPMEEPEKKEAALNFIPLIQSVEQINQPLNDYVTASESNFKEFMDVYVDKNTTLDILIDSDRVLRDKDKDNNSSSLRNILKTYGAIVVKFFDGKVDNASVETYVNSLLQYISRTKNHVKNVQIVYGKNVVAGLIFSHFLIHCKIPTTDSTSSCPLTVKVYSTRGGISLYLCLSNMPPFSNSLSRIASVLVLKPFNACLNFLCLTGLVVQHRGIRISSVPLFVIKFLSFAVSDISNVAS